MKQSNSALLLASVVTTASLGLFVVLVAAAARSRIIPTLPGVGRVEVAEDDAALAEAGDRIGAGSGRAEMDEDKWRCRLRGDKPETHLADAPRSGRRPSLSEVECVEIVAQGSTTRRS